jgi:hypothetical protein
MVGVLQIIFGLHPIACELSVASQILVLFKQLGGIPALTVVLPVTRLTTEILPPLSTAAAPAAALTIIDQNATSLRSSRFPPWALSQAEQRRGIQPGVAPDPLVPVLRI